MIYVAYDHLGVGDSSIQHNDRLTVEMIADGNHALVTECLRGLRPARWRPGYPRIERPFTIGTGQSMGAGVTIVMQGRSRTFDAVGILGVSAIHTQLPQRTLEAVRQARAAFCFTRSTPIAEFSVAHTSTQCPISSTRSTGRTCRKTSSMPT